MWDWANAPQLGRLGVEKMGDKVRFIDRTTGEFVTVNTCDSMMLTMMAVNDNHGIECKDAKHFTKGEGIAKRDVYHFVNRNHATALRAGLTVHHSAFSSTPHRFERSPEPGFEEAFYFLLPNGGKGILEGEGLWPDGSGVNAAWPVAHRQLASVPMGWHRVIALPDADGVPPRLGYIWAYLALKPEWEKDG